MTYKELIAEKAPGRLDPDVFGGVEGCPPDRASLKCDRGIPSRSNCERCWNREVEEK